MVKTKVKDLAEEFATSPEQVLAMLRDMGVTVRHAGSAVPDDQVSAARVRWEREKRRLAAADAAPPKKARRKKAAEAEAPPEEASAITARVTKRRRTAAEVAESEATLAAEREAEPPTAVDLARTLAERPEPAPKQVSLEERARALFKDLPPSADEGESAPKAAVPPVRAASTVTEAPSLSAPAPSAPPRRENVPSSPAPAGAAAVPPSSPPSAHPERKPFIPPRVVRPTPVAEGRPARGRGPTPVFSSSTPTAQRSGGTGAGSTERPARTFGPDAAPRGAAGRKKGKKGRRAHVDQDAVQQNIMKTLQGMKGSAGRKGRGRVGETSYRQVMAGLAAEERELEKTRIRVNEFVSVSELAESMKIPATAIVQYAFKELGLMVTVNQRLDFDQIELIASQFGFEAIREDEYAADVSTAPTDAAADLVSRPPVVTIMGHVDHGKTSLLDHIRKANIVAGEAGGITQHIGAYHVVLPDDRALTFLDTPGHEAFTAMRARGAQVTDIVVLVIAADDQVMPQTVEAISHARNAGVPIVVAINKVDLPTANVAKVKQDLLQQNVVLEEFGGTVLSAEISAKTGRGVDHLLDQVLLQAEMLDVQANAGAEHASGTVLEAALDPGKGPIATILIQRGTLVLGHDFICGMYSGRVRAMHDERGKPVRSAGPSIPVQVLGFDGVPAAGDTFLAMADAAEARQIAQKRQRLEREAQNRRSARGGTLEDFSRALREGQVTNLPIILKADQGGPAEALADAIAQLSTSEVRVDIVHRGVGAITESDVLLAKASGAIIIGFHVRPDANARATAEREQVDVRTYRVIYEAVDDVRQALEGLLKPEERETILGEAEVLEVFKVSKVGTIAGSIVRQGTISRAGRVRVVRDGKIVYAGGISSLKRFKDDVKEVRDGLECGIGIENFNDVKVGDRIEAFRMEEIKRTLESAAAAGSA